MYDQECPLCQASVPPSQSICDCGYSFNPNELEAAAQDLILTAREDEAYLDYLQVRFNQALETQDVAHTHLQGDPENEQLQTQFEQAKTEAIEAQQELGALQARMIKTRASVKTAKETVRKVRVKKERLAAKERARLEAERQAKEAAERKAHEEAERKAAKEKARLQAERKVKKELERAARKEVKRKALQAVEEKARRQAERLARKEAKRKALEEAKRLADEAREQEQREATARRIEEEAARRQAEDRAAREAAARRIEQEAIQREAAYKAKMEKKQRKQQAAEKARHATQMAEQARLAASAAKAAEHAAKAHLAQQHSSTQPVITKTAPQAFIQEQSNRAQSAVQMAKHVIAQNKHNRNQPLHVPNPAESSLGFTPADYADEASPLVAGNEPVNSLISHTSSVNANEEDVCPHCTATLKPDQNKCGCGFERRPDDADDGLALSLTDVDQAALSELSKPQITKFG